MSDLRAAEGTERRRLPVYASGAVDVPYVIEAMGERLVRDTHWEAHSHPTHELLWNEAGASTAEVDSRVWTITPTIGLWMPAGVVHTGSAQAGTWMRAAQFGPKVVESISDEPVAVEVSTLLRLLLRRLVEPELGQRSRALTQDLVIDLVRPSSHAVVLQVPRADVLAPIVEAVMDDPADPRGLQDWSREIGVSSKTLARAFERETAMGFSRWVLAVRVQHAVRLMSGGHALEDIAYVLGYATPSAFSAAFKRATGLTPSAFRAST